MSSISVAGDVSGAISIAAPSAAGSGVLTLPVIATDTLAGIAATQTLTNKTLVAPALGTPASGNLANCTGVVAGALPAGCVIQVVYATYSTVVSNSTATYADSGLTATITPKFATSKILVSVCQNTRKTAANAVNSTNIKLFRDATDLGQFIYAQGYTGSLLDIITEASFQYLDSPSTTSATTYKTKFANYLAASASQVQADSTGVSTITLMEIAG